MSKDHMVAPCCSLAPYSRDSLKTAQLVRLQPKPRASTRIHPWRNQLQNHHPPNLKALMALHYSKVSHACGQTRLYTSFSDLWMHWDVRNWRGSNCLGQPLSCNRGTSCTEMEATGNVQNDWKVRIYIYIYNYIERERERDKKFVELH